MPEVGSHVSHQSLLAPLQILMRGQDVSKREWKLVRGAVVEVLYCRAFRQILMPLRKASSPVPYRMLLPSCTEDSV